MSTSGQTARRRTRGGTLALMDDEMVEVLLVGGPMDGTKQPMERWMVFDDEEPGADMVPDSSAKAPESIPWARVLYTAEPGGPPDVWLWRGWVP